MTSHRMTLGGLLAVGFALVGCGYTQAPGTMPQAASASPKIAPDSRALLYVANGSNATIEIYKADAKNPAPIGAIRLPYGTVPGALCFDSSGTLYVLESQLNKIVKYQYGKRKPYQTLTKGLNYPEFCAIDHEDNLWVSNYGTDEVVEFEQGSKKPSRTVTNGISYPAGLAFDANGNLYVANTGAYFYKPSVVVYAPSGSDPWLTIKKGITAPLGIAVDSKGTLYVVNGDYFYQKGNDVEEYLTGTSQPYRSIKKGIADATAITINAKDYAYIANIGEGSHGEIAEYAPGSTKPSSRHIEEGLDGPSGVALYPPVLP